MNARIWGIIGGVALALALLSPLVLGNSKKVENFLKIAEELYEHSDYKSAIIKYKEALEGIKKIRCENTTNRQGFHDPCQPQNSTMLL